MLSAVRTWVGTLVAGVEGARHRPSLVRLLPEPWAHVPFLGLELWQWLGVLFTLSAAVLTALLMQRVLLGVLGRVVRLTG
ncbi:MAG TPA: hypothetical protein VEY30_07670, partial [Myxococcaceae bacterium]|nr:hypothetical protein [Myxococcaceae bacterium]